GDKVRIAPSPTAGLRKDVLRYMFSSWNIHFNKGGGGLFDLSSDESIKLYGYLITHIISIE
ncbi:hypothetical protein ACA081_00175, partial [Candidatus Hodgkinia cicadicola]